MKKKFLALTLFFLFISRGTCVWAVKEKKIENKKESEKLLAVMTTKNVVLCVVP